MEKNKILEEKNILLTEQLKELQDFDAKKTAEITILKDEISGMQSLIDQKTAEVWFDIFIKYIVNYYFYNIKIYSLIQMRWLVHKYVSIVAFCDGAAHYSYNNC